MPERHPTRSRSCAEIAPERSAPEGARVVPLTRGWVAWVDAADYDLISQHEWFAAFRGTVVYAARSVPGGTVYMHRELIPDAPTVDHREHRPTIRTFPMKGADR